VKPRPLRPRNRAALLLLVAPFVAASAGASDTATRPGRFRLGPFWLTPRVELRGAGRDTNVYNARVDAISDAAAVLSPSLEVAMPVGQRFRFSGRGFLNVNWFHDETSQRSTDRGFLVRGESDVGPVTVFGETGRGWYKRRFTIDLDERLPYLEASASVGARLRVSQRLTATAAVDTGRFEIGESPAAPGISTTLDRDTRGFRFEGRYRLTKRTSAVASGEWLRDRFDESLGEDPRDVTSGRYLAGFEFTSRALTGRLRGGVRQFPTQPGAPSYTGPALQASLRIPVSARAQLQLEAEREVYYAARPAPGPRGSPSRNSYTSWRSRSEIAVELPLDLLFRGLLGYEDAAYLLAYADPGLADDASHRWTYGVTLLRVFGDHLRLGGGITWEDRAGETVTAPYHGARWGVQAEFAP
jgi:hypothetical protein